MVSQRSNRMFTSLQVICWMLVGTFLASQKIAKIFSVRSSLINFSWKSDFFSICFFRCIVILYLDFLLFIIFLKIWEIILSIVPSSNLSSLSLFCVCQYYSLSLGDTVKFILQINNWFDLIFSSLFLPFITSLLYFRSLEVIYLISIHFHLVLLSSFLTGFSVL